jgi:endoglucanase
MSGNAPSDLRADVLARPLIRVNQFGYLPDGPKFATLISSVSHRLDAFVFDASGHDVWQGQSEPHSDDAAFSTHVIDFSDLAATGRSFTIRCDGATSRPFAIATELYGTLADDAVAFFYPQRSGIEITNDRAPGYARPAGHIGVALNRGDTRVSRWRGSEADELYPGWVFDATVDASGGWYDAGDHGKYVVCGGLSAAMLLATHDLWRNRSEHRAREVLDEAMWEVDWILRMQVPPGHQHAGLAFHRIHDDRWTELPLLPHLDPALRVLHRPSTAAGLNLAAVAAQAARYVPDRHDELVDAAVAAFDAALAEPDLFAPNDHGANGGGPYDDDNLADEFYWAACELYLTTGQDPYRRHLTASPCHHEGVFRLDGFDWDMVAPFARLQLAVHADGLDDIGQVRSSIVAGADDLIDIQQRHAWDQPYQPTGGYDWGSNGRILSNVIVIATASRLTGYPNYRRAALRGIDYILGRNPTGLSFVTGYGTDHSHRQRVRHFGHALDPDYPFPPTGAIAGGAASKNYPGFPGDPRFHDLADQLCYTDEPTSETTNDICIRWNAALAHAAALLATI